VPTCPPELTVLAPPDAPPALGLDPPLPLFWALLDEQEAARIASAATASFREYRLRVIDFSFGFLRGVCGLASTAAF
jgi:hypothetical protein